MKPNPSDFLHHLSDSEIKNIEKNNFISYLEGTLIPDLIASGSEAMAEDFKTCIQYMR